MLSFESADMKTCTYTVHLEPAPEGGYTVTVPALPAIVTEGDTDEQALEMAHDAIRLYVGALIVEGRPVPEESPLSHAIATHVLANVCRRAYGPTARAESRQMVTALKGCGF
jgi:predicted RNase H-like HicB family nuclease